MLTSKHKTAIPPGKRSSFDSSVRPAGIGLSVVAGVVRVADIFDVKTEIISVCRNFSAGVL